MRLHKTDPERERAAVPPAVFEVLAGAAGDERTLHILVVSWIGKLVGVQPDARIWLNADKLPYPRYDEDMKGSFIARRAGQYLEDRRRDGRPFALWVSFMEPHSPYDFPVEDRSRFDPTTF